MLSDIQCQNPYDKDDVKYFYVVPDGYNINKTILANIDHCIRKNVAGDNLLKYRKNVEKEKFAYKGLDALY